MKILGIDTGTNSLGLSIRDTSLSGNQIVKSIVITFSTGVGHGEKGEFSYAAERTKHRSTRRLYQARKYRLWTTLEVLIENKMCPLTIEELNQWRKYIKGSSRQYPIIEHFENWIKLDFNEDGKPDYTSPYQLRAELATQQFDLANETERYKLGRALYHIAQRRGFKSSKGETLKDREDVKENKVNNEEIIENIKEEQIVTLKKSEEKLSKPIEEYIEKRKSEGIELPTLGSVLADIENNGDGDKTSRVRKEWLHCAIRQKYEEEINYIFEYQKDLVTNNDFHKSIYKAIFYRRPLRSQKGLVGKCTLEPSKSRCPISHPDFEAFRAWSLINNIRYKYKDDGINEWQELDLDFKKHIFNKIFLRVNKNFNFSDIAKEIIKKELVPKDAIKFNYIDKTNVAGCPVTSRLIKILGEDWENVKINTVNSKGKSVSVNWEDIWHIWFSADDEDMVNEYARNILKLDDKKCSEFMRGWIGTPVGYAMLSLKAIRNINPFLTEGFIYSEAALLAKMPEILEEKNWNENQSMLISEVRNTIKNNKIDKYIFNIVNSLISNYKRQELAEKHKYRDINYKLNINDDDDEIQKLIDDTIGKNKFAEMTANEQDNIKGKVVALFQNYFKSSKREYYKLPPVAERLNEFLTKKFTNIDFNNTQNKLYHPSMIDIYPEVMEKSNIDGNLVFQLGSPKTGSFKNPMAMRALYELRKIINYLLRQGEIDENTRVVVELSRELNDSNRRWAIEKYQQNREEENKEYAKKIEELGLGRKISDTDIDKYRLWVEQKYQCIYTGKIINATELFSDTAVDIEHTIPRSISFDNSLANLTVCDAKFNREIKKNQIPFQLSEHQEILARIEPWKERIKQLENNIENCKKNASKYPRKPINPNPKAKYKDDYIRQRHIYQMELDYWSDKVYRFEMKDVTIGFKHSQLVDNQLISKYAFHYLKSVFQNVSVQKGSTTAEFRKIYGIQEKEEKKDRSKHSHHAKDAAVLTLIPSSAERDRILNEYYKKKENNEKYDCKPYDDFISSHIEDIDGNILINNIGRDNAFVIAKKNVRNRGKIAKFQQDGNKVQRIAQGDCVRGQLHDDTFLGKNKIITSKLDKKGNKIVTEEFKYVKRIPFDIKNFEKKEDIEKKVYEPSLVLKLIEQEEKKGKLFKDIMNDGLWHKDKNGKLTRIRHIRVKTSNNDPLEIKKQTYKSTKNKNREHKQSYYAVNAENYCFALYQGKVKGKIERDFELFSLFKVAKFHPEKVDLKIPDSKEIKKGVVIPLYTVLKTDQRVLFYKDNIDELRNLDNKELSKRLYRIFGFENDGRLNLQHHIDASIANKSNGESKVSFHSPHPILRITREKWNFAIEGKDFDIKPDGTITFK